MTSKSKNYEKHHLKNFDFESSRLESLSRPFQDDQSMSGNFSEWYNNSMKRVEYLNKLISSEAGEGPDSSRFECLGQDNVYYNKPRARSGRDLLSHPEACIDDMSAYQLREHLRTSNNKMKKLCRENELMREVMRQATDYGNLQLMAAEIKLLEADRDRLRKSLNKVVEIEDKIVEYKRQAAMSKKLQFEVENLRKELEMANERGVKFITECKNQIGEMELQVKIAQKERNEYRNRAEKLEFQYDLVKFELDKSKIQESAQCLTQDCLSYERITSNSNLQTS